MTEVILTENECLLVKEALDMAVYGIYHDGFDEDERCTLKNIQELLLKAVGGNLDDEDTN